MLTEEEAKLFNELKEKDKSSRLEEFKAELEKLLQKYNVSFQHSIQVVSN